MHYSFIYPYPILAIIYGGVLIKVLTSYLAEQHLRTTTCSKPRDSSQPLYGQMRILKLSDNKYLIGRLCFDTAMGIYLDYLIRSSPEISIKPQSVKSPHYGWWCWHCLIIVWWSTASFSIRFKSELLLGQSKTCTASHRSRSFVFAVCDVHGSIVHEYDWSCSGWVVKVWRSLIVEELVEIPPGGHICPGFRSMAVCKYGKGTTTLWRKRLHRHVVAGHRQDGDT